MNLALFDFDGTITRKETISEFLQFCVGKRRFLASAVRILPAITGYFLKLVDNQAIKESLISSTIKGWEESVLWEKGEEFAQGVLPELIRPQALERIEWHRARGDRVVLVSASLVYYLRPWAASMGIGDVVGVELEVIEGKITGRLKGKNCFGQEKVRRIKEKFRLEKFDEIYAYGDSRGDKEMLSLADYPYFRPFR